MLTREPKGAILPLGGDDLGHKGFALALLVEMLTASLGGFGRADRTDHWGASVFLQVIDPRAFGGIDPFRRESGELAQSCRTAKSRRRTAGAHAGRARLAASAQQLRDGVALHPEIWPALSKSAGKFNIAMPKPIGAE